MNFNFHQKPDYSLNTGLIDELIRLYGTPVRFLVTEKLMDSWGSNAHEIAEASLCLLYTSRCV